MLGLAGGTFGILISLTLGFVARLVLQNKSISLGSLPVNQIGVFPWWLIVSVLVFTTVLGMLSGLYPAIRASKMKPVDALRYE
jgi:ABC-type lipoprotein release transport system permease subunit